MRRVAAAVTAALLLAGCASSPDRRPEADRAPASPPAGPVTYLALGDSVAAGAGARTPATEGYVPLLADGLADRLGCADDAACLRLENLAEGGATTATLRRRPLPRALELLDGPADVRLVTLTVGGNDVFEPVVRACAAAPTAPGCRSAVTATLRATDEGVREVLRAVTAAAGPGTTVAVMTYYNPLSACRLAPLESLAELVLEGDGDEPGLNDVLRARAAEAGAVVVETPERLSSRADFVGDTDCLHPSGQGHARIAEAFLDEVGAAVSG